MVSNLQESNELLSRLQQDFNNSFQSSSEKPPPAENDHNNVITGLWIPPINIHESDCQFFVSVNISGINIRDIEMHIENGILSIKAELKLKKNIDPGRYNRHCNISNQGGFYRRFRLPETADPNQVTTKIRDGVVTITLGKHPRMKAKLINQQG